MAAGTYIRWLVRHAPARVGMAITARRPGSVDAALFGGGGGSPYPLYDRAREAGRLVLSRLVNFTAHHDVGQAVLRSPAFGEPFTRAVAPWPISLLQPLGNRTRPIGPIDPPALLAVDPPRHTRYRKLVSTVFTARAIEAMRPRVQQTADELLAALPQTGEVDLVHRYAGLLPVTVIAEILGVPLDMREQVLAWGSTAAPVLDLGLPYRQYATVEGALREFNTWMRGHFEQLRRAPGDDLCSRLVTAQVDGQGLDDDELVATAGLLLAAGFETTVNLLGSGAVLLLRNPGQLALLREDPSLWRNAVEEILRYEPPVQTTARMAKQDTEIAGLAVREGQVIAVILAGANRDPAVFDDPNSFDVTRANARDHLSFSSGIHHCLGASLARLEGEVGLRTLFERYPGLRLAGRPHHRPTRTLRGYDSVPVTLTGGPQPPAARDESLQQTAQR
jgi:hypothetical protein